MRVERGILDQQIEFAEGLGGFIDRLFTKLRILHITGN
jgi:hypothetical protein